jgi:hypothetical protein
MKLLRRILKRITKRNSPAPQNLIRKDLQIIPIEENLKLLVYWKVLEIGKGPAVILQAFDKEILKFDCFGKSKGHFHIAPHYDFRIFFFEESVPEQISRTLSELRLNGLRYLKMQADPRISSIYPDPQKYLDAILQAEKLLTHFHQTVEELKTH